MVRRFIGPKRIIGAIFLLLILFLFAGVYVAVIGGVDIPGLSAAFRVEPEEPSPDVLAHAEQVEADIREAIQDKTAFFLELTDEDLSALLVANVDTQGRIHKLAVEIRPEDVKVSGEMAGRVGVGFSGIVGVTLEQGQVEIELLKVSLTSIPTPGFVRDEIQPFIDDVLDLNERLRESGATQVQAVNLEQGKLTIIGVQSAGSDVSAATAASLQSSGASGGAGNRPAPPGGNVVPPGTAGTSASGSPVYLAMGDSLSANVGVTDARQGYVSRFHAYLQRERGQQLGLVNVGVSGESSISIFSSGQLEVALNVLRTQDIAVLTIDLGANDLVGHIGSDDCMNNPRGAACTARIAATMAAFPANFRSILTQLKAELADDAEFYVMTVYNPFDMGIGLPIEDFSSQVVADLNELIATEAAAVGAKLADPFDDMADNAGAWTHMLTEADIHPTAEGFQVLALSLAEAREGN